MNSADVLIIGGVKEILLFISFLKYPSCKASFAFSRLALSITFYRPACPWQTCFCVMTDMFLTSGQYQWGELRSACNHHYQLTHNHFAVLWILSGLRFFYFVCRFLNCLFLSQIIQPQKCITEFLQNAWGCSFNERYIRKLCGIVQVMISLKWYSIHSVSTLLMMVWDTGN